MSLLIEGPDAGNGELPQPEGEPPGMNWLSKRLLPLAALVLAGGVSPVSADNAPAAAGTVEDFADLSLNDLLNTELSVASSRKSTQRESPGIVTVITADEIARMGARDLIDVLRQVPGFGFVVDVQGVVGTAMRGNHSYEGKIGVFLDGHEMNDLAYATVPAANRFPVDLIHRIEIIRGPGSAVYGGNSELAVINVVTKLGSEIDGGRVAALGGVTEDAPSRVAGGATAGKKSGEDLYFGALVSAGNAIQSDRNYTDVYGSSYSLAKENSAQRPFLAQAHLRAGGFRARLLAEHYRIVQRDDYDAILNRAENLDFGSLAAVFDYSWKPSDTLTVTPSFTWRAERPWQYGYTSPVYGANFFHATFSRYQPELRAVWEASPEISVAGGASYTFDHGSSSPATFAFLPSPVLSKSFHRFAAYAEVSGYFPGLVNVTAGGRVEHHNDYGWAGGPRIALTRMFGDAHLKGLYSMAYRTPGIANIWNNGVPLKPEYAHVFEVEAGYTIMEKLFLAANYFEIILWDPFAYAFDPVSGLNAYLNFDDRKTGTRGVEVQAHYKDAWGYVSLGYSFSHMAGRNEVYVYDVPGHDDVMTGMANHKLTALASVNVLKNVSITPSMTLTGRRMGYETVDAAGSLVYRRYEPELLLDVFLLWKNSFAEGLDTGIGIHNLLDADFPYLSAYDNYHAPLASPSREYLLKVAYEW